MRLWRGGDQQNYASRPVVELLHNRVAVQWWISPRGDGWNGSLTCLTGGPEPNCDLIDSLGMHAEVAEMLILRAGRLVHPPGAEAITNSVGMRAADLNADGYLDVIGTSNDYLPNFAPGRVYWQTFRYAGRAAHRVRLRPAVQECPGADPPAHRHLPHHPLNRPKRATPGTYTPR